MHALEQPGASTAVHNLCGVPLARTLSLGYSFEVAEDTMFTTMNLMLLPGQQQGVAHLTQLQAQACDAPSDKPHTHLLARAGGVTHGASVQVRLSSPRRRSPGACMHAGLDRPTT